MDGLFLVDKPLGPTSHDVVARLRRALGRSKAGHFGTLDPLATGLLLVAVGSATRLNPYYSGLDKSYQGRLRLGFATDTYDREGRPVGPVSETWPEREAVEKALQSFRGPNDQLPPPFSAKKVDGRPLYKYARRGQTVGIRPSRVMIHGLWTICYEPPFLDINVHAAAGTYIRSLAHDLGQRLGCGAHLAALRRTRVGEFTVESALPLVTLEDRIDRGEASSALIPFDLLLPDFRQAIVDEAGSDCMLHGRSIPAEHFLSPPEERLSGDDRSGSKSAEFRVLSHDGRLLGLARPDPQAGSLTPLVVFMNR